MKRKMNVLLGGLVFLLPSVVLANPTVTLTAPANELIYRVGSNNNLSFTINNYVPKPLPVLGISGIAPPLSLASNGCSIIPAGTETHPGTCNIIINIAPTSEQAGLMVSQTLRIYYGARVPLSSNISFEVGDVQTHQYAVGSYSDINGNNAPLILTLTNGIWDATQPPSLASLNPQPDPSPTNQLNGIFCVNPNSCMAVGQYTDLSGHFNPLILNQSDGVWEAVQQPSLSSLIPAPNTSFLFTSLVGVYCSNFNQCIAGGFYLDVNNHFDNLILSSTNGVWTAVQQPSLASLIPAPSTLSPNSELLGVSCIDANHCFAVGDYIDNNSSVSPLILGLTNGTWSAVQQPSLASLIPAPKPTNYNNELHGIFCTAPNQCIAVGDYIDINGHTNPLILTFSNGTWTATQQPSLAALLPTANAAADNVLFGISCTDANHCIAVGEYLDLSGNRNPLILNFINGAWIATQQPSLSLLSPPPIVTGYDNELRGVSCVDSNHCLAVGFYEDINSELNPLILTLTNTTWAATQQPSLSILNPAPNPVAANFLSGVH